MNIIIRDFSLISEKRSNSFSNRPYWGFGNFIFPNAGNNLFAMRTPVIEMDERSGNNFFNHNVLLDMLINVLADRKIRTAADGTFLQRNSNILVNSLRSFSERSRMAKRCAPFLWNISRRISFGIKLFKRSLLGFG